MLFEKITEIIFVFKTARFGDLLDLHVAVKQQILGFLQA